MNDDICIIIPTRNEEKTIARLIDDLHKYDFRNIIVVDDSTDETPSIAIQRNCRVACGDNTGLGGAIRKGMNIAREKYRYAVVIDAGGTQEAKYIPDMLIFVRKWDDALVIGSRFAKGHPDYGFRTKVSLFAVKLVRLLFNIGVKDATTGFRCYDLSVMTEKVLSECIARGHAAQIELLAKCRLAGGKISEVPVSYPKLTNSSLSFGSFIEAAMVLYQNFMFIRVFGGR